MVSPLRQHCHESGCLFTSRQVPCEFLSVVAESFCSGDHDWRQLAAYTLKRLKASAKVNNIINIRRECKAWLNLSHSNYPLYTFLNANDVGYLLLQTDLSSITELEASNLIGRKVKIYLFLGTFITFPCGRIRVVTFTMKEDTSTELTICGNSKVNARVGSFSNQNNVDYRCLKKDRSSHLTPVLAFHFFCLPCLCTSQNSLWDSTFQ